MRSLNVWKSKSREFESPQLGSEKRVVPSGTLQNGRDGLNRHVRWIFPLYVTKADPLRLLSYQKVLWAILDE